MKIKIYTDGAARGNPGPAGIGIVIINQEKVLAEISDYIGKATNNVAEYMALIRGLEEAIDMDITEVEAICDSELLVKQIQGEYRVKNQGLIPLYNNVKGLLKNFKSFSISHTRRENNKQADLLANQGIDNHSV
ncbi:MAG: ribonuclease HI family protein [Candidatus Margulisiibacteriota bacterium]